MKRCRTDFWAPAVFLDPGGSVMGKNSTTRSLREPLKMNRILEGLEYL